MKGGLGGRAEWFPYNTHYEKDAAAALYLANKIAAISTTQLHSRFTRKDNRQRFGKGRAIVWNIRVLGRFKCAKSCNIPIPSYGIHAACA